MTQIRIAFLLTVASLLCSTFLVHARAVYLFQADSNDATAATILYNRRLSRQVNGFGHTAGGAPRTAPHGKSAEHHDPQLQRQKHPVGDAVASNNAPSQQHGRNLREQQKKPASAAAAAVNNNSNGAPLQQHGRNLRASSAKAVEEETAPVTSTSTMTAQSHLRSTSSLSPHIDLQTGQPTDKPGFDFIVAGFPKCGTTTLLKAFAAHDETDMATSEQCSIASPKQADARVHKLLDGTLSTLTDDPSKKRSFKCPTAMYNYKSIARMEKHSPETRFIVGMRHPVEMFQSFYNYRITEIKERGLQEDITPIQEILESGQPWKGVSLASTRFELFLLQMGKTDITTEQMHDMKAQQYDLAIKPTNFTVFLYTTDQLEDADETRSATLRTTMQEYLGLQNEIMPFGHENKNHNKNAHPEQIYICDDQWASIRKTLVEQGAVTAAWLRDSFIHSKDVFVANPEHFVQTLESWAVDPCEREQAAA